MTTHHAEPKSNWAASLRGVLGWTLVNADLVRDFCPSALESPSSITGKISVLPAESQLLEAKAMNWFLMFLFLFRCMCITYMNFRIPHVYRFLQRPEKGIKAPGSRVVDHCEMSSVGAGYQTQAFCKNGKHSSLLSHFSSLGISILDKYCK